MQQPMGFPETRPSLLARLGDKSLGPSAWRQFFDAYAPAVYRVARARGFSEPDADDLVQQVMMRRPVPRFTTPSSIDTI